MRTKPVKAGACAGVALALAVVGWTPGSSGPRQTANAAVGDPSVVLKLPAQGIGLNGGKDIRVRVKVTCRNGSPEPIVVRIRQQRGPRVVRGVGQSGTGYRCNGVTQTVPVLVHANRNVFVPGTANAIADVQICNTGGVCVNGHDQRVINLVPPNSSTTSTTI